MRSTTRTRVAPQKPPRDADAEELLRLCREGRLFELQAWVASGKRLTVPAHYRRTPIRVAIDTGFHSLIEFLLQHEPNQAVKDQTLIEACWANQRSALRLALDYGANVRAISFTQVLETWDREVIQLFLERGADAVTDFPFARAFKGRVKSALGAFLDCKRARPELADALQQQADVGLRQACQDDDLKWVSLLMWLGDNPRTKGLTLEDIENPSGTDEPCYQESALQIACRSRNPEILKRLKPDPAIDDVQELMAAAASFVTTPETVSYLVKLGADVNDKAGGGSSALSKCLQYFGWADSIWLHGAPVITASRLGKSLDALQSLLKAGARWLPENGDIARVRRTFYRIDAQLTCQVVDLLRLHRACDEEVLREFLRTPKMQAMLASTRRRPARAVPQTTQRLQRHVHRHPTASAARLPGSLPPSRYDRQRLYEEVWSEPTQRVAQRYGVSDVAIGKACSLLGIPKPPRGYWAKKAAGLKLPKRPPLPSIEN